MLERPVKGSRRASRSPSTTRIAQPGVDARAHATNLFEELAADESAACAAKN
jgi:hypothetical protein